MSRRTIFSTALICASLSSAGAAELSIFPREAVLFGKDARQRIAVTWTDADGIAHDVSEKAAIVIEQPAIAKAAQHATVRALAPGTSRIDVSYHGHSATSTLKVLDSGARKELSFVNDIVPVFTKFGCAGSNCHGSIRGKAGFKLSLFGYEPALDYQAIVKADGGRRINLQQPEQSLILKKPTFQVPHGGGVRFEKGALPYNALLDWMKAGAKYDTPGSPRLVSISVFPMERWLIGIREEQRLLVSARYTDGSVEDVTDKVQFSSNDDAVANVGRGGIVTALSPGESTIMVRTLGQAVAARIFVVKDPPLKNYPAVTTNNFIDSFILEKLKRCNIVQSDLSSDEHFLRRAYLDIAGVLPGVEEAREFLESRDPEKRSKLIDKLLDRPERADCWATYFADLFQLGFNESRDKGAKIFYDWIRENIRRDKPYNQMVSELLVSQGNLFYEPTSNFYFVTRKLDPGDVATHITQSFLGVRLECARCHNHPFEKWTQDDFYGFAAFFSRLATKFVNEGSESDVYLKDEGEVIHPKTKASVKPKYLDGTTETELPGEDVRQKLARWVTARDNPYFARTIVNRIWRRYFGRGIVEPVDDFRITNPPSHEKLLDALAADFVSHGYSIKHTERVILNSRTWQISSLPNDSNRADRINYSHYYLRRMSAEQLLDAVVQVTGVKEHFAGWPSGTRAMQIPHGSPSYLLTVFGRVADREFAQDRKEDPSITQVLHLINGETLNQKIGAPEGRLARWLAQPGLDERMVIERLFLAALSRLPREKESSVILKQLKGSSPAGRSQVYQDLEWALLNSKEFLYVH